MALAIELRDCSCGAAPGTWHRPMCDHARCPACGEQLIGCAGHEGRNARARWHGIDQRAEVARSLSWWTTAAGISHPVEDYTRVLFAIVLGQVTWDQDPQRYVIGQVDEAAIDEAGRGARPPYIRQPAGPRES
jgi:hypothetical protein